MIERMLGSGRFLLPEYYFVGQRADLEVDEVELWIAEAADEALYFLKGNIFFSI
jgi:hypothetical protein